ncbi:Radical SAM heme biosynthesis protein AhbD, Fe-coproporphyrin III decarboxylase [hydrothermal vent metagenome]|uniref:Radical SAM heme biosynthesis protein AhbD, Fe-coproporphyrin III decarboxylase n=1 Tax=hydrothermal vent metagenome TaxID=652676 RepID=A0A3B1AJA8_9ZZZZ
MNDLYLIAVNLTRRCNLRCEHCYLDADTLKNGNAEELSSEDVCHLLDEIAQRSTETMVVLTGGEPLLRRDLEALLEHGSKLGLFMVVGSNGVLLKDKRVQSLKAAGAMGIGISLDSLDPEQHNQFRGSPKAWQKTLAGMESCRHHGLAFQIHFSVTEANAHEVQAMIDFARASGAWVLNFFFLVCTGRGESMTDISPARYEQVLNQILQAQEQSQDLIIRARCAPHFQRIAYQRNPDSFLTRAEGYDGSSCIAGTHYCRITPEGGVTACPYIEEEVGNLREDSFNHIWDASPALRRLRAPALQGKCGQCEYQALCGGCRARALAIEGDLMSADPWCSYLPQNGTVIAPWREQSNEMQWSSEALQRLSHVPGFLRKMIKKRAETYVREQHESLVTQKHLDILVKRRFGTAGPPGKPATTNVTYLDSRTKISDGQS